MWLLTLLPRRAIFLSSLAPVARMMVNAIGGEIFQALTHARVALLGVRLLHAMPQRTVLLEN